MADDFQQRMHDNGQDVYDKIVAGQIGASQVEAALLDAQLKASQPEDTGR